MFFSLLASANGTPPKNIDDEGLSLLSYSHSLVNMASQRSVPPSTPIIMQHRSLTRTREWAPQTPASERSIVRNHSPYCESTGPIVQEGFVASRIRALQDLHNKAQSTAHSRSPMIPCPPRWLQIYSPRSPPTLAWSTKPIVKSPESLEIGAAEHLQEEVASSGSQDSLGELPAQTNDPFDAMLSTGVQECQKPLDEVPAKTTEYFGAIIPPQEQESPVEPPESCAWQTPSTHTLATDKSNNTGIQTPPKMES